MMSRREAVRGATFALALAPIPAAAATGVLATPVGHPDARLFALKRKLDEAERALEVIRNEEQDKITDRYVHAHSAIMHDILCEPAHSLEGLLLKADVGRNMTLGSETLTTPEAVYADIRKWLSLDEAYWLDALWADLTRIVAARA